MPKPSMDKRKRFAVASADDAFADIRKRAYGSDAEKPEAKRKPVTAADLDPAAIFDKWNAAKARGELDDDYDD